jgi:pimeloyl-ACP methyl ester carboxylesterase
MVAMVSDDTVTVYDTDAYIYFSPIESVDSTRGLMFYQGAKVEAEAYAVLGHRLATSGIPVVIVKMPLSFAIFDYDRALDVKAELGIGNDWALGGHSLGGAMAARLVYNNPNDFSALILLASYPSGKKNDLSQQDDLEVLSIWGSADGLVTQSKILEKAPFLPAHTIYTAIMGGNHAQFGSYGIQSGDGQATISADEQLERTVNAIADFMQ